MKKKKVEKTNKRKKHTNTSAHSWYVSGKPYIHQTIEIVVTVVLDQNKECTQIEYGLQSPHSRIVWQLRMHKSKSRTRNHVTLVGFELFSLSLSLYQTLLPLFSFLFLFSLDHVSIIQFDKFSALRVFSRLYSPAFLFSHPSITLPMLYCYCSRFFFVFVLFAKTFDLALHLLLFVSWGYKIIN